MSDTEPIYKARFRFFEYQGEFKDDLTKLFDKYNLKIVGPKELQLRITVGDELRYMDLTDKNGDYFIPLEKKMNDTDKKVEKLVDEIKRLKKNQKVKSDYYKAFGPHNRITGKKEANAKIKAITIKHYDTENRSFVCFGRAWCRSFVNTHPKGTPQE